MLLALLIVARTSFQRGDEATFQPLNFIVDDINFLSEKKAQKNLKNISFCDVKRAFFAVDNTLHVKNAFHAPKKNRPRAVEETLF